MTLNRHCDDAVRSEGTKQFGDFQGGGPDDDGANRFPAVPCFRMIARPAAVKLRGQKSFVFHHLTESATSCVQAKGGQISREIRTGLAGKEQGKNRGIAGGAGEPAKATRLRLYRRHRKEPPRSPTTPRGHIQTN
jgi:hypothetical protein